MKLSTLASTLAVGLCTATLAQARIGWTLEECIQHYGPDNPLNGLDKSGSPITWHKFDVHGWDITVVAFENGKVTDITYEKPLKTALH